MKKTNKEKWIEFSLWKNSIIEAKTGIKYFTDDDVQDIRDADDKEVDAITDTFIDRVNEYVNHKDLEIGTATICFYCRLYIDSDCRGCGYGDRHGDCNDLSSTYFEIGGNSYIKNYFGQDVMKAKLKEIFIDG